MSMPNGTDNPAVTPPVDLPRHWTDPLPEGWVGIARDSRTAHYWCATPPAPLPSCVGCRLWMTDWSLINACPGGVA